MLGNPRMAEASTSSQARLRHIPSGVGAEGPSCLRPWGEQVGRPVTFRATGVGDAGYPPGTCQNDNAALDVTGVRRAPNTL